MFCVYTKRKSKCGKRKSNKSHKRKGGVLIILCSVLENRLTLLRNKKTKLINFNVVLFTISHIKTPSSANFSLQLIKSNHCRLSLLYLLDLINTFFSLFKIVCIFQRKEDPNQKRRRKKRFLGNGFE